MSQLNPKECVLIIEHVSRNYYKILPTLIITIITLGSYEPIRSERVSSYYIR